MAAAPPEPSDCPEPWRAPSDPGAASPLPLDQRSRAHGVDLDGIFREVGNQKRPALTRAWTKYGPTGAGSAPRDRRRAREKIPRASPARTGPPLFPTGRRI